MIPDTNINPERHEPQPVASEDIRQMRADIAAINDKLTVIFEVLVGDPARLEAARQAQEAEDARQMAEAIARGDLDAFIG